MQAADIQTQFVDAFNMLGETQYFGGQVHRALVNQALYQLVANAKVKFSIEDNIAKSETGAPSPEQQDLLDTVEARIQQAKKQLNVHTLQAAPGYYGISADWFVDRQTEMPEALTQTEELEVQASYRNALKQFPKDYMFKPSLEQFRDQALKDKQSQVAQYTHLAARLKDYCNEALDNARHSAFDYFDDFMPSDQQLIAVCKKALKTVEQQTAKMVVSRNLNWQADIVIMGEFAKRMDRIASDLETQIENAAFEPFGMAGNETH